MRTVIILGVVALLTFAACSSDFTEGVNDGLTGASVTPTEGAVVDPTEEAATEERATAAKKVTFKLRGQRISKAQTVHSGDYRVNMVAHRCDGNVILQLTPPGDNMFGGHSLSNDIVRNGKSFKGETYVYGLEGGKWVINAQVAACGPITVVLTPEPS
jgi:hypothetical protein